MSSSSSSSNSLNLVQFRDNESAEFNKNWLTLSLPSPKKEYPKTFQLFNVDDEPETLQEEHEEGQVQETQVIDFHHTPQNNEEDREMQQQVSPQAPTSTLYRPTTRTRRTPTQNPEDAEPAILDPPPFPWATSLLATVHSMDYLLANGINSVAGEVTCKKCENRETVSFDLRTKFKEVENFVGDTAHLMHSRAPQVWLNPGLMTCSKCQVANQVRPIIDDCESHINWLFLFLGQWLGCCTLGQLKWFCKYTQNHRTGAKDRVLFYTYAAIGKQLDPQGVFNLMHS